MTATARAASISAVAALMLAAAWLFWPTALGGGTTYVTTHGNSMEPGVHTGDLAILRAAGSYAVGDVVAYRSATLDTIVMHRIVSGDADGFVTQGDSNDWLDEDRPAEEEILGRLFVNIPHGGKVLDALRSPGAVALAAGAAAAVVTATRRPRGRHTGRSVRRRRPASFSLPTRARARQVALGSGAVTILAAAGSAVLWALPSAATETRTVQVIQQGQFTYSGEAVPGTTYPAGAIATGDPIWTRLARELTVTFTNTVSGPGLRHVKGAMRLDVVVTAADGWSAVVGSGPVAAMENGTATASVGLDTTGAAALLSRHYAEIGVPGGAAKLSVTPVAVTTGSAEGTEFTAGSPAALDFDLGTASLTVAGNAATALAPSSPTAVEVEDVVPRSFTFLAVSVPISVARIGTTGVLAVALAGLTAGAWVGRTGRRGVADQFLVRHADRIVPIAGFDPGPTVIDVSDAESLHRVAERFDTLVLHHAAEDEDVFAVRDADATYRFVVPGSPDRRRGLPPVPAARASEPEPLTAPLPRAVPAAGGVLGRFA